MTWRGKGKLNVMGTYLLYYIEYIIIRDGNRRGTENQLPAIYRLVSCEGIPLNIAGDKNIIPTVQYERRV